MALSMFKNASNQKTDATLKDQLFKMYNFVAWPKKICIFCQMKTFSLHQNGVNEAKILRVIFFYHYF